MAGAPDSVALLLFFVFWYAGNMKYNEYNTASLNAVGGKTAGLTMTVATLQLGVCAVYAIIMWIVKINPAKLFGLQMPSKQSVPKSTGADIAKTLPVGFCSAAAHACTVFALGGDPLFGQIVKSGEPVLSAIVNTIFYGKPPSTPKIACLPIIVGGVAFASLKKSAETGGEEYSLLIYHCVPHYIMLRFMYAIRLCTQIRSNSSCIWNGRKHIRRLQG